MIRRAVPWAKVWLVSHPQSARTVVSLEAALRAAAGFGPTAGAVPPRLAVPTLTPKARLQGFRVRVPRAGPGGEFPTPIAAPAAGQTRFGAQTRSGRAAMMAAQPSPERADGGIVPGMATQPQAEALPPAAVAAMLHPAVAPMPEFTLSTWRGGGPGRRRGGPRTVGLRAAAAAVRLRRLPDRRFHGAEPVALGAAGGLRVGAETPLPGSRRGGDGRGDALRCPA